MSLVIGAVTGVVIALALFTFVAASGAVRTLMTELDGADVVPTFAPSASATWIMVILAGLAGGALIATVTRTASRVIDPGTPSAPGAIIVSLGAVIGATIAMVVYPLGITVLGSITEGNAVIGVADFVVLTAVAGLIAGAGVAWFSYILARPSAPAEDPELLAR